MPEELDLGDGIAVSGEDNLKTDLMIKK